MKTKNYNTPEIEILKFGAADIIQTSGLNNNGDGTEDNIGGNTTGDANIFSLGEDMAIFD